MISKVAPSFWKGYGRLPREIKTAAKRAFQRFQQDQSYPSLHLERLRADPRAWSVRVTRDYRAVARRYDDTWAWFWIGSHQEFDRQFRI